MALPPVLFAVNATVAEFGPRTTDVMVVASGTVAATKLDEAAEAALLPNALVTSAVQVYVLPFVSELTVTGEVALDADWVAPPSLDVHVTE
jgi:hypothetical protein